MPRNIIRHLLLALLFLAHPVFAAASPETSSAPTDFSTKILGGTQSKSGDWPWMAALLYSSESNMYYAQYCSGVLIDSTWVLTAAHCVKGITASDIDVAVGVFDLNNFSGSRIPVKKIYAHPAYNTNTHTNDIALLELSQSSSQPTVILFSGESEENAQPSLLGRILTAIGWGMADGSTNNWYWPEKLRQVNLPVVTDNKCHYSTPLISSQICAGYYEGKDVCNGDSGGPVVTKIDGTWTHVGLVSYGASCRDYFGWYGIYTRTSEFVEFIKSYVPSANFTGIQQSSALPWMNLLLQ